MGRHRGGYQTNTAPVYRMPWGTVHPTTISAPIVGMAYGAYDAHVAHQGTRVRAAFAGEKAKDDPFAKVRIAEAASDIDAAWRQLSGNVADEYALLSAGKEIPLTCGPAPAAIRCAPPGARSLPSTGCSRPPGHGRPTTHRCNASGATRTPDGCTRPTTPSGLT